MEDIIVNDWDMLSKLVFTNCWDEKVGRYRSNYIFRGLSCKDYTLIPSLNRTCHSKLFLERNLIRNFEKYASEQLGSPKNLWDTLSLAQHHGMPTRLLDWTFSPLVAAHFATEDFAKYEQDGVIWCLDFVKCNTHLPSQFRAILKKEDAFCFSTEMLSKVVDTYDGLLALGKGKGAFPIFFEPPAIDGRIVNQYALFSVMSDPAIIISEWMKKHDEYWYRLIIPSRSKLEIRDKLDQLNITERIIYPGLDGLGKWLARHYTDTESIYVKEK